MGFIGVLLSGLVIGLLARAFKPGDDRMGIVMTVLLGVAGALVAGYVGQALNIYQVGEPAGWIASILGAVILLAIVHAVTGRRRSY